MPSSTSTPISLSLLFLLSLLSLIPSISSHAVLISPLPYNSNPTKTGPCGVNSISSSMQNNPSATWAKGQSVTIRWNLVASDGGGNVIGEFDPNGGTTFTVQAWDSETFDTAGSNKFYNKTFIVPQTLDCSRSPSGFCTFRVRSVTNWFSCSTVKICGTDCVAPPPAPKVCTKTNALPFCSNSTSVSISEGSSVSDVDSSLSLVYTANLNNPLVFATPDNAECKSSYKTLLCGLSLPSCNPSTGSVSSGACKSQCQQTMKACSVKPEHIDLYQCDTLPECDDQLKASKKGGMSPGGAAALSIFLIALVGALAFAGFMYYKKGHLFGYAFDKHEKRIVKFQSNPHNYTAYEDSL